MYCLSDISIFISIHVPAWGTTAVGTIYSGVVGISIHVPAWGTTINVPYDLQNIKISIHVPAWGTTAENNKWIFDDEFQSTFPRGERLCFPCCD